MTRNLFCAASLAMLCGVFAGEAQQTQPTPPTPAQAAAHHVQMLTEMLSLTSAQQTQATTYFTAEETALSNVRSGMKAAHSALATAIENNDSSGIAAAATQIGELTTQEVQAHGTAAAALYLILNSDQQAKFKAMLTHGPGFGGPHGPGGPGMMPPPPPPPGE